MKHMIAFGSRVYGLINELSDYDNVLITDEFFNDYKLLSNVDIEAFSPEKFKEELDKHSIKAIEVYFTDISFFHSIGIYFNLDKNLLRHSVSAVVSNAYVKSKKKIIQGDVYVGLKSYFHCIRILKYANQLAENNYLKFEDHLDFLKPIYEDIISHKEDEGNLELFKIIDNRHKDVLKELRHNFKLLCPK